jgi:hypothetical protein
MRFEFDIVIIYACILLLLCLFLLLQFYAPCFLITNRLKSIAPPDNGSDEGTDEGAGTDVDASPASIDTAPAPEVTDFIASPPFIMIDGAKYRFVPPAAPPPPTMRGACCDGGA